MKRRKLVEYFVSNGCVLVREGARHTEINDFLCRKICWDLGLQEVR